LLPIAGLGAGILALALAVWFMKRWYGKESDGVADPNEMLAEFREAEAEGDLSEDEFRRIKLKLADEIRGAGAAKPTGGDPAKRSPPRPATPKKPAPSVDDDDEDEGEE
ncbi:MAG TPA: hypothetical protein VNC50_15055, partial [Planctomycetia bacterium]|nr:hypothetical protein [Planctomycetia bacterium]